MSEQQIRFRLPRDGWPRAEVATDYSFRSANVSLNGVLLVEAADQERLRAGISAILSDGSELGVRLAGTDIETFAFELAVDGQPAIREGDLRTTTSRSAWKHGWIALAASLFGFLASYLYLGRAETFSDAWALKMAIHMAGWHLLLVITLFPASIWGGQKGIRAVQGASLVFFLIHVGIALANGVSADGPAIALLNGASGVLFGVSIFYGQIPYKDMDPVAALLRTPAPT